MFDQRVLGNPQLVLFQDMAGAVRLDGVTNKYPAMSGKSQQHFTLLFRMNRV